LINQYVWSIDLYGAETWTLRAVDQKHLESFEMWCWRRMEKISWIDHVRNEDVLLRVKEQRNILHEIRNVKEKNILLFKFRCNIFICVRIIKETPGSVASGADSS
jgi:hypothetical protein